MRTILVMMTSSPWQQPPKPLWGSAGAAQVTAEADAKLVAEAVAAAKAAQQVVLCLGLSTETRRRSVRVWDPQRRPM